MFSALWLEFRNLALIRGGDYQGGVLHDTDTNQEYILRKVENYPTYRIPYILREVGNITNI